MNDTLAAAHERSRARRSARVVLIMQARMGSTRLQGKTTMALAGAPLICRIIERVKRCRELAEIVLATTDTPADDILERLGHEAGVTVFRGSEHDLVDRYHQAAKESHASAVVRLPADNPVPEPSEIDRIVRYHLASDVDFSSNLSQVLGNGYPDGIGAEVIDPDALESVWRSATAPRLREHPHLNFFDYSTQTPTAPDRFTVGTIECPLEFRRPDLVLDVNTPEQYEFMKELYEYLYPRNPRFGITDIINWYDHVYRASRAS